MKEEKDYAADNTSVGNLLTDEEVGGNRVKMRRAGRGGTSGGIRRSTPSNKGRLEEDVPKKSSSEEKSRSHRLSFGDQPAANPTDRLFPLRIFDDQHEASSPEIPREQRIVPTHCIAP